MNDNLEAKMALEFAIGKVLETLQTAIVTLVNAGDDVALQHLQTCTNELYRRAAECRTKGKQMAISDDYKDGLH
jgi:hypothetical protein